MKAPMKFSILKIAVILISPLTAGLPLPAPAAATARTDATAGLTPYQRPANAPVIQAFTPDAAWRARALTGIREPIPASLDFLNQQGAWYTPFNQPGMPGYYDLRNWRGEAAGPNNASR